MSTEDACCFGYLLPRILTPKTQCDTLKTRMIKSHKSQNLILSPRLSASSEVKEAELRPACRCDRKKEVLLLLELLTKQKNQKKQRKIR